ncbi:MAG: hypothetical protein ACI9BD_000001 [Candidatus Marinamargulisbacteria bacterium]
MLVVSNHRDEDVREVVIPEIDAHFPEAVSHQSHAPVYNGDQAFDFVSYIADCTQPGWEPFRDGLLNWSSQKSLYQKLRPGGFLSFNVNFPPSDSGLNIGTDLIVKGFQELVGPVNPLLQASGVINLPTGPVHTIRFVMQKQTTRQIPPFTIQRCFTDTEVPGIQLSHDFSSPKEVQALTTLAQTVSTKATELAPLAPSIYHGHTDRRAHPIKLTIDDDAPLSLSVFPDYGDQDHTLYYFNHERYPKALQPILDRISETHGEKPIKVTLNSYGPRPADAKKPVVNYAGFNWHVDLLTNGKNTYIIPCSKETIYFLPVDNHQDGPLSEEAIASLLTQHKPKEIALEPGTLTKIGGKGRTDWAHAVVLVPENRTSEDSAKPRFSWVFGLED